MKVEPEPRKRYRPSLRQMYAAVSEKRIPVLEPDVDVSPYIQFDREGLPFISPPHEMFECVYQGVYNSIEGDHTAAPIFHREYRYSKPRPPKPVEVLPTKKRGRGKKPKELDLFHIDLFHPVQEEETPAPKPVGPTPRLRYFPHPDLKPGKKWQYVDGRWHYGVWLNNLFWEEYDPELDIKYGEEPCY